MSEEMMTASDIAKERGWTYNRAWRWLHRMERKWGDAVVRRDGRNLSISMRDYQYLAERIRGSFHLRLSAVEEAVAEHDRRLDSIASMILDMRKAG